MLPSCALLLIATGGPAAIGPRVPRAEPARPRRTAVRRSDAADRIILKFREGTGVRLRERMLSSRDVDTSDVARLLADRGAHVARGFDRAEADLEAERVAAELHAARTLADLNLYYRVRLPAGVDAAALCDALNALPSVELATPAPRPAPPPTDIAPTTPDLSDVEGHRAAHPAGIGVADLAEFPGADGDGVQIADVEYSWVLDHEDIGLGPDAIADDATPVDPFPELEADHGTAVLGELIAGDNGYGVTGIAPRSTVLLLPANTEENGYDVARAVSRATGRLVAGDVILIEQQRSCACGGDCPSMQDFGPVEALQATFDAVSIATAQGIVVVEPAGNGGLDLDDPSCGDLFNRGVRDSGAIVVGAGSDGSHSRLGFSSFGSRVDVQGWGIRVGTTGFGDAFATVPDDLRQRYTQTFSGTSSASAMVAGVVAAMQGARRGANRAPLPPATVRQILIDTGTPQGNGAVGHIGPLPDVDAALGASLSAPDEPPPTITTSSTLPSTTTTLVPVLPPECGAAGDCDDADTCTIDTCEGGVCAHVLLRGVPGAACRLDVLVDPDLCAGGVEPRLAAIIAAKVQRAQGTLRKVLAARPRRVRLLVRQTEATLDALAAKIRGFGRRRRITRTCRDTLIELVAAERTIVAGLMP